MPVKVCQECSSILAKIFPNVNELDMTGDLINAPIITRIFAENLLDLVLDDEIDNVTQNDDVGAEEEAYNAEEIEWPNMSKLLRLEITETEFNTISCRHILGKCQNIITAIITFNEFTIEDLEFLGVNCKSLQYLYITNFSDSIDTQLLVDTLSANFPNLIRFSLSPSEKYKEAMEMHAMKVFRGISTLREFGDWTYGDFCMIYRIPRHKRILLDLSDSASTA